MNSRTRQPRQPNEEELESLTQLTASRYGYSDDPVENKNEARRLVKNAYIAVFDDYTTGGPGYAGKVMTVVWDGSPSQYDVYTWENGDLAQVEKE
jgi:hypothetical protein